MDITIFFADFPNIPINSNVVMREIDAKHDAEAYYAYMTSPKMRQFVTIDNVPTSVEKAQSELEYWAGLFHNKKSIYWAIALEDSNQIIGTIGFNNISFANSRAEIGYDLDPNFWGRGIMLHSMKRLLIYSDIILKLVRVQAYVIDDNERSIKLLDRTGFKKEGAMPKYEVVDNVHKDYFLFGRINESALIVN